MANCVKWRDPFHVSVFDSNRRCRKRENTKRSSVAIKIGISFSLTIDLLNHMQLHNHVQKYRVDVVLIVNDARIRRKSAG